MPTERIEFKKVHEVIIDNQVVEQLKINNEVAWETPDRSCVTNHDDAHLQTKMVAYCNGWTTPNIDGWMQSDNYNDLTSFNGPEAFDATAYMRGGQTYGDDIFITGGNRTQSSTWLVDQQYVRNFSIGGGTQCNYKGLAPHPCFPDNPTQVSYLDAWPSDGSYTAQTIGDFTVTNRMPGSVFGFHEDDFKTGGSTVEYQVNIPATWPLIVAQMSGPEPKTGTLPRVHYTNHNNDCYVGELKWSNMWMKYTCVLERTTTSELADPILPFSNFKIGDRLWIMEVTETKFPSTWKLAIAVDNTNRPLRVTNIYQAKFTNSHDQQWWLSYACDPEPIVKGSCPSYLCVTDTDNDHSGQYTLWKMIDGRPAWIRYKSGPPGQLVASDPSEHRYIFWRDGHAQRWELQQAPHHHWIDDSGDIDDEYTGRGTSADCPTMATWPSGLTVRNCSTI